jgi:hypothetical protein
MDDKRSYKTKDYTIDNTYRPQVAEKQAWVMGRKFNGNRFLWEVYPDYWKDSWGPKPLLGTVRADEPFYAKREAYDTGLLQQNATFGPQVFKVSYERVQEMKASEASNQAIEK